LYQSTKAMSTPILRAFYLGRAAVELLSEGAERTLTDALSELGKFDAEQRLRIREFSTEVQQRAERFVPGPASGSQPAPGAPSGDLQAAIDDLRAEMAEVRAELQRYRNGGS
jgi:uncharacterized protein YceH (UPF0502 family)